MPKVRIGHWQLVAILANLVYGKAIGFSSGLMAQEVGRDAWLAMLMAFAQGFVFILPVVWLARRFPTAAPMQYVPRLVGRYPGILLLLLLGVLFAGAFATSAITIELHINDYLMTETPFAVFVVAYSLIAAYGAYLGIEVVGRLGPWGLLMSVTLTVLMTMGTTDHFDHTRLLPLFDNGVARSLLASRIAGTDVAVVVVGALVLLPLMGHPGRFWRAAWWGLAIGGVMTTIWPIFEIAVLGPNLTAQYLIACMQQARAAELSIYVHRYELIMVILFVYGVLIQSIVTLYAACEVTARVLPGRIRRVWLIAGVTLLLMPVQYYLAFDRDRYAVFLRDWWPGISLPLAYGIPLLLALVAWLRPGVRGGAADAGVVAPAGAGGGGGNSQT